MKTDGESERCGFLNAERRCSIHALRPGLCRIFPLGRYYENRSFQYFLQVHECKKEPKLKVKVQKWIDTPDIKRNEKFIIDWHYFLKDLSARLEAAESPEYQKTVSLYVLKNFYQKPWDSEQDFYEQFQERLAEQEFLLRSACLHLHLKIDIIQRGAAPVLGRPVVPSSGALILPAPYRGAAALAGPRIAVAASL